MNYAIEWPQFFTATIQEWKHLLKEDKYKTVIIDALNFLATEQKVTINGFVIMSNHLHIIWQSKSNNNIQQIQNSFIKHTSKAFKKLLSRCWHSIVFRFSRCIIVEPPLLVCSAGKAAKRTNNS